MLEIPSPGALDKFIMLASLLDELRHRFDRLGIDPGPYDIRCRRRAIDDNFEIGQEHAERPWSRRRSFPRLLIQILDGLLALRNESIHVEDAVLDVEGAKIVAAGAELGIVVDEHVPDLRFVNRLSDI